jgi:hypothetical protein
VSARDNSASVGISMGSATGHDSVVRPEPFNIVGNRARLCTWFYSLYRAMGAKANRQVYRWRYSVAASRSCLPLTPEGMQEIPHTHCSRKSTTALPTRSLSQY